MAASKTVSDARPEVTPLSDPMSGDGIPLVPSPSLATGDIDTDRDPLTHDDYYGGESL